MVALGLAPTYVRLRISKFTSTAFDELKEQEGSSAKHGDQSRQKHLGHPTTPAFERSVELLFADRHTTSRQGVSATGATTILRPSRETVRVRN